MMSVQKIGSSQVQRSCSDGEARNNAFTSGGSGSGRRDRDEAMMSVYLVLKYVVWSDERRGGVWDADGGGV